MAAGWQTEFSWSTETHKGQKIWEEHSLQKQKQSSAYQCYCYGDWTTERLSQGFIGWWGVGVVIRQMRRNQKPRPEIHKNRMCGQRVLENIMRLRKEVKENSWDDCSAQRIRLQLHKTTSLCDGGCYWNSRSEDGLQKASSLILLPVHSFIVSCRIYKHVPRSEDYDFIIKVVSRHPLCDNLLSTQI